MIAPGAAVLCWALAGAGPAAGRVTEAPQVDAALEMLLAEDEFHHLRRFREDETTAEEKPPRETSRSSGAAGPGRAPGAAGSPRAGSGTWTPSLPDLSGFAGVVELLVYVLLAAVLVWVAFLAYAAWRGRATPPSGAADPLPALEVDASPGEREPDEWLRQALAHARAGRHGEALRALLLGALAGIERRGLIRPRRGLTNGDYLRAVLGDARLHASLEPIVLAFDEVHFGRRALDAARFEACVRHYRAGFQA